MRRRARRIRTILTVLALAAVLAACGGNGDGASDTTGAAPGASDASADTTAAGEAPATTTGDTSGSNEGRTITWVSTGGGYTEDEIEAFQKPFTEATGIEFENISPVSQEQIQVMVETDRVVWDVINARWHFAYIACDELYEPLDQSLFEGIPYPENSTHECFHPYARVARIFSYNAESYPDNPPDSIDDFFDTENYPGTRAIVDQPDGILEAALVADGVDPSELYPMDLDRAFAKLDTIKDDLLLAPSFGALEEYMVGGQADMTITVTARSNEIRDGGVDLVPVWDYTTASITTHYIVKNSPNADIAQELIRFIAEPEQQIKWAELSGLAPARDDIDPADIGYTETQAMFNAFAPDRGDVVFQDLDWFAEHADEVVERWTQWQLG